MNRRRETADVPPMFIAYALHRDGPEFDQEIESADLDEALTHLRELITSESANPSGSSYAHYGIRIQRASQRQVWTPMPSFPPVGFSSERPVGGL